MIILKKHFNNNDTIIMAKHIINGCQAFTIDQLGDVCDEFEVPASKKQKVVKAYALHIKKYDEQKDLEEIANDAAASYFYAKHLLKYKPFPQGEKAIATSAKYSYWYAQFVLEAPFPQGETAIATRAYYSCQYAKFVLKAPFPKGEAAIATDEEYLKSYKEFLEELLKE